MENTIVILGNGFDFDLGMHLSFEDYCHCPLCPAYVDKDKDKDKTKNIDKAVDKNIAKKKEQLWSNFENDIREKILAWSENQNDEIAKDINQEWLTFQKFFSFFFTWTISKENLTLKNSSYAYQMLENFSDKCNVYTFNYTYPYEYAQIDNKKKFTHVHGRYYRDTFDKELMVMSQSSNMIVGIDYKRIPKSVYENKCLSPIIKQLHPAFHKTDIEEKLLYAKTVIFFGVAMGITDSDYFDEFFTAITNKTSICEVIYYITLNKDGFDKFRENIEGMGYRYALIEKHVKIIPIYTEQKIESEDFKNVLSLI